MYKYFNNIAFMSVARFFPILCLVLSIIGQARAQSVDLDQQNEISMDSSNHRTADYKTVNASMLDSSDDLWNSANRLYAENHYAQALDLYSMLYGREQITAELCYNIGNCYYRMDSVGQSVLWYSRALKLDPSDEDAQYNLLVAQQKVRDRIEPLPEFFLKNWITKLGNTFSSNQWSLIALVMFTLAMFGVFVWFTASRMSLRKVGFYGMLVVAILFVCSLSYAMWSYSIASNDDRGVVIASSSVVKSSPSVGGKDLFVLHSGTDFRIIENLDGWSQIVIADGSKGWIATKSIERI